jgi:hypothetical protein
MRVRVWLCLGLVTLLVPGCGGGGHGFVDGTVKNSAAKTMHVGMAEGTVKQDLHGTPLDELPYYAGQCVYYRGVDESARHRFTATGSEWMFCFHKDKLSMVLRTCAATWRLGELDRYKKAGWKYNTAAFHGNGSDCTH